jgi:hypothetical protein
VACDTMLLHIGVVLAHNSFSVCSLRDNASLHRVSRDQNVSAQRPPQHASVKKMNLPTQPFVSKPDPKLANTQPVPSKLLLVFLVTAASTTQEEKTSRLYRVLHRSILLLCTATRAQH